MENGGGPRRGGRPAYRRTPNFRADASRKSGSSLGAGVQLGESFSAPAGAASNALGGEKAVDAGFGRRKISWSLGDTVRARTTVVAPIRSADERETPGNSGRWKMGKGRAVGADQHTDGRQILGRIHPASRGLRWEPESSWGRAFPRRRVRRQTLWAEKRPLMPVSGGAKFLAASGTLSAPGRPSSHRFGRRMRGKPPKTAVDGKWGRSAPWGPTSIPTDAKF